MGAGILASAQKKGARSRKMAVMAAPRYLCSQLVRLIAGDREQWVTLEEIWRNGAVLECEEAVPAGVSAGITAPGVVFSGHVAAVEPHEFGWRVEFEFSPLTLWSPDLWLPEHALDPGRLGG